MEYKLSAYADDVLCFLDGSVNSCRALFNDLGVFAKYSGLKPNISKTQAFWAGVNEQRNELVYDNFNFKWTEQLKVLGIVFTNDETEAQEQNFENKLRTIQSVMNSWKGRYITVRGRITLIKALLFPKLVHIFVSLSKPPTEFMKRLKTIVFHFIWGGKSDRVQRLSICKPYNEGGLAMFEIETYVEALKATWVRREMLSNHSWTTLFQEKISKGSYLWERNSDSLKKNGEKIKNPFWTEVLQAFASVSRGIKIDVENMNRCSLWFSEVTKHKTTCINAWKRKGLCYLSDVVNEMGDILTFQQTKQTYQLCGSYLDYVGLIGSLSREWKFLPKKVRAEYPVIHPQVQVVLSKENGAKYLYNVILQNKTKNLSNSWELEWEIKYGEINWPEVYRAIHQKSSVYYHVLSYKIITQTVATNRLLHAMGIRSSPICSRCKITNQNSGT